MPVLKTDIDHHIALVTLNRPESRNALNPELIVCLANQWQAIRDDENVRVVILTGADNSTFCAGFDLGSSIPLITGARAPEDEWDHAIHNDKGYPGNATLRDFDIEKPLIIAANGHAIAGGMEMLLAGDIRIVAAGAKLGLSEVKLGLIPAMGGTARLARHMPTALASEMLLTGNPISAERALTAGIVNYVVAAEDVLQTAKELAEAIAGNAPLAVKAARRVMRKSADISEADALALEQSYSDQLGLTEDAIEGPNAFMEKRAPVFRGK
jgi:enoyl-CoA hydratase